MLKDVIVGGMRRMKRKNMRMSAVVLAGMIMLPAFTAQAGNLDMEFFRQVQQSNTVFCEFHNTAYLSDQYIAFDMDQDGADEVMVYHRDPDGADGNFHWKIFKDGGNGNIEFLTEDDGSDVGNAGHSLELIDGRCVHDHDGKGVVSYMYDVDTYVFCKDSEVIQLVRERTQNYNESKRDFDEPIDVYKVNGNEISKEEGERLLSFVPEGETVDISEDSSYNIYADDSAEYYYDDEYIFPASAIRYLDESDIAGMSAQELSYGRNEIYARYGRIFKSQELRDYFTSKEWYSGDYTEDTFPYDALNEYEKYNAKFLKEQEEMLVLGGYTLR